MDNNNTKKITLTALIIALTILGTMLIRIPVPATQGYIHLGDSMLILSVITLGWKKGAIAGGLGQALADLLSGYAMFAPITLVVKILMGLLIGLAIEYYLKNVNEDSHVKKYFSAGILYVLSGFVMVGGYYIAETFMYGSLIIPLAEVPANIIQFFGGSVIAMALVAALNKTPAKRYFTYSI